MENQPGQGVTRRDFLRYGAAGGLTALAAGAPPRPAPPVPAFELEEMTIAQLQEGMRSGQYTARSLAQGYLERIRSLDRQGPTLRHMLDLNPEAEAIAARLDEERRAGRLRGPLHGIPVIVKDNVDTADRMTTTAGSLALEGSIAPRDAFLVERLREAGAVILGKASLSEWANFRSTRSSSAWCARGGQGKNPYVLDRNTCGSSSGTGGGIAANYAAVGIGTETDGSITCPAALCSLVGLKPTVGLVSRSGIIPISHSQDTAGPMTRTVTDAAVLLGVLTGVDPRDPATAASRNRALVDYTRFLDPNGLRGARIGVPREGFYGYSEEADRLVEEAIRVMKDAGAVIVDPANLPHRGEYDATEFDVMLYEFKHGLNEYLKGLGPRAPIRSLREAIDFNERNRDREMPYFGQEIFHMAEAKGPLTEREYLDALERNRRLAGPEGIDRVMDQHRLDALLAPTGSPAWPIDLLNGDHFTGAASTPAAVAGYPHITVPAGYSHGLPVGLSLFGRAWSEGTLLKLAYAYEQATRHRQAPRYLPTLDLS